MMPVKNYLLSVKKAYLRFQHDRINKKNLKRFNSMNGTNRQITIIANNCIGGFIYHYLGLRFESPTINLFILPKDYIKMLKDFKKFFDPDAPIIEVKSEKSYPVGEIYGCKLYFMHYKQFDEAVSKWRERCRRININSIYVMMTDRDGCTLDDMKDFDSLDYKHKVIFTCSQHDDIKSSFYIHGFTGQPSVGQLHETMSITGKRYIDQFDYVNFLSSN